MIKIRKNNHKKRIGTLSTRKGKVSTPFFMPIATKGAVKAVPID